MLKFSPENNIKPEKGKLLLAEPFLDDPYFKRTVIYLCEHNEEGSFGFVLNNYIDMSIDQIMADMPNVETKVSVGGPVKNTNLYYIHTLGDQVKESIHVDGNIYMGGDFDDLKNLALTGKLTKNDIRFFIGYSGWSPGQLSEELELKSWFVANGAEGAIMNSHVEDLWGVLVKDLGNEYSHLANLPKDPNLN